MHALGIPACVRAFVCVHVRVCSSGHVHAHLEFEQFQGCSFTTTFVQKAHLKPGKQVRHLVGVWKRLVCGKHAEHILEVLVGTCLVHRQGVLFIDLRVVCMTSWISKKHQLGLSEVYLQMYKIQDIQGVGMFGFL